MYFSKDRLHLYLGWDMIWCDKLFLGVLMGYRLEASCFMIER